MTQVVELGFKLTMKQIERIENFRKQISKILNEEISFGAVVRALLEYANTHGANHEVLVYYVRRDPHRYE